MLGRLKTRKSRRRLVIPDCLLAELSRLVAGRDPDDLVFTTVTGAALHHSNFTRVLDRAIKAANAAGAAVPRFRAHALRHTHAAWLLTQGRTMYQVSKQLGHESEQTTDKYYGHLVQAALDANADAVQVAAMGDDWDMSATVDAPVELSAADMLLPEFTPAEMDGGDPDAAVAA